MGEVMANKFYAYFINENTQGVVDNWPLCQEICKGQKSKYKSFLSEKEAKAWLENGMITEAKDKNTKYYAVHFLATGENKIYFDWDICKKAIGNKKTRYKSFKNEKEAKVWLDNGALYENKEEIKKNLDEGIYFDAGTGRGIGVETRVTDKYGNSLVNKIVPEDKVTEHGNYLCKKGSTNNYGELMGLYIALKLSLRNENKKIFGDSKLIIEYWSKGIAKINELPEETTELIKKVKELRGIYENWGGVISHVSGDYNPADLGFHR
jgi:ribonuclease HI